MNKLDLSRCLMFRTAPSAEIFMSYRFILFAFNLIDHQYSICRMYLEENSQVFRFLVSYLLSLRVSNAVFECRSCI